jgi:hypothetical protein
MLSGLVLGTSKAYYIFKDKTQEIQVWGDGPITGSGDTIEHAQIIFTAR